MTPASKARRGAARAPARVADRTLLAAGDQLARAREAVAAARRALARISIPAGSPSLVGRDWAWAREILEAKRPLLTGNPDVIGLGLGYRVCHGITTDEPAITVYVRQKRPSSRVGATRRLPRSVRRKGRTLQVDVVSFGDGLERQLGVGSGLGDAETSDAATKGTLGSFAIDATGRQVAITAMHVVGDERADLVASPMDVTSPSRRDRADAPVVAQAVAGTMSGIDAALLRLSPEIVPDWSTPAFFIRGWRKVHWPGDHRTRVRLFGATSGFLVGHIHNVGVDLPEHDLADTIIASIPTQPGDSGAAIVDDEGLVLGFLAGRGTDMPGDLRVFCPASLVLHHLDCTIPRQG